MEELRKLFDMVTLCMQRRGIVKDVRRIILMMFIEVEYIDRHRGNCVGEAYNMLSLIMLKPALMANYTKTVTSNPNLYNPVSTYCRFIQPMLLSREATDFILTSGVLGEHKLPLNHPSEKLGILTPDICTQIISAYVHKNGLKHPVYTKFFAIDEKLEAVVGKYRGTAIWNQAMAGKGGPYEPKILEWKGQATIHCHFTRIINIVQYGCRHSVRLRFVTKEMPDAFDIIGKYFNDNRKLIAPKSKSNTTK